MPLIVAQISDAHLGPRTTVFQANMARIEAVLHAAPPQALVGSGDLSLDGAGRDADLAFAAAAFRRAAGSAPLLTIPGNHDVGSDRRSMPDQPVDAARLARWQAEFGADRFCHDLDGPGGEAWRLIGLNTEIMGTGLAEEAAQAAWLVQALEGLGRRRIAAFLHKPAFVEKPSDPFDYWSVPPEGRPALVPLLGHPALRLVASGHLHLHRMQQRGQVVFAWAPPASFVCEPEMQPGLPGDRVTGFLRHTLHPDHVETELVCPAGLRAPFLEEVRAETYPKPT
ncbi:metallophosphoesterase family protein [Falsiroseomonas tokyonensis]|uniref:Metallophosphoesterase family protein n=1 Tax=Falsiroseomonas tokyonensis TaxID=430521 RepID=A0ABV7BSU9_9PROT|nr:metallophosphoesterase [Falsiroseomonas tokyonensis]MBU8537190.1 metallophosphoesterase family protein [Falsiroseomonas tokyonensis]